MAVKGVVMNPDLLWFRTALDKKCRSFPDTAVFRCLNPDSRILSYSYGELNAHLRAFPAVLERLSLRAGDRVLLASGHIYYGELLFAACAYWNITLVPLDMKLPPDELNRLASLSDVRAVFTDTSSAALFEENIRKCLPFADVCAPEKGYPLMGSCHAANKPRQSGEETPEAMMILFSSGTTQAVRPVLFSCRSMHYTVDLTQRATRISGRQEQLFLFPLSHISAISGLVFILMDEVCCTVNTVAGFTPKILPEALRLFRPTFFGMVPRVLDIIISKYRAEIAAKPPVIRMYYKTASGISAFFQKTFGIRAVGRFLMTPFRDKVFGKNMRYIYTGSTASLPKTAAAIMDMGILWCNIYASTECGVPITITDHLDHYDRFSVGSTERNRDCIRIRIHEPDADGNGEIYVKSALVTEGYFRDPQLTAAAFSDGWFCTGDIGYIKKHHLYLTGRAKEAILLSTGKKVSPEYLESVLLPACPENHPVIICGVHDSDNRFDEIHAFFETGTLNPEAQQRLEKDFLSYARSEIPQYPVKAVHFIEKVPRTSIGKVKRFLLAAAAVPLDSQAETSSEDADRIRDFVYNTLHRTTDAQAEITDDCTLSADLGLGSLGIFSFLSEIETKYGTDLSGIVTQDTRVGEVIRRIEETVSATSVRTESGAEFFPRRRGRIHSIAFRMIAAFSGVLWKISVSGLENLPDTPYLLCPNHQSNMDTLCLIYALGKKGPDPEQIACFVKKELMQRPGFFSTAFGGIPVDRAGGADRAIKSGIEWLTKGGCLLIYPEGTRTPDGNTGTVHSGFAVISKAAGVPVVPVRIDGTFACYPKHKKIPGLLRHGKRFSIQITIRKPLYPLGASEASMTAALSDEIGRPEPG